MINQGLLYCLIVMPHDSPSIPSHASALHTLLQAKAQFKRRSLANNVEIFVPVPNDADSPRYKVHK